MMDDPNDPGLRSFIDVDPASANPGQPNESVVANNIQTSFDAFEDDNDDGLADH